MAQKRSKSVQLYDMAKSALTASSAVCIDVGAFRGDVTAQLRREFPALKVYAIEACPTNYAYIANRFKDDALVVPCHYAITDEDGPVKLHVARYKRKKDSKLLTSESNSLFKSFIDSKDWARDVEAVEVEGLSLDSFCRRHEVTSIDLLKINCEGCEYKLFGGPCRDTLDMSQAVFLSLHGRCETFSSEEFLLRRKDIMSTLQQHGFRLVESDRKVSFKGHVNQLWVKDGK